MNPTDQELVERLMAASKFYEADHRDHTSARFKEAAARLTSLSQANERMAGALEPFAKWADEYGTVHHDSLELWQNGWEIKITVGDCRRARSALSDLSAPPGDSKPVAWQKLLSAAIPYIRGFAYMMREKTAKEGKLPKDEPLIMKAETIADQCAAALTAP